MGVLSLYFTGQEDFHLWYRLKTTNYVHVHNLWNPETQDIGGDATPSGIHLHKWSSERYEDEPVADWYRRMCNPHEFVEHGAILLAERALDLKVIIIDYKK